MAASPLASGAADGTAREVSITVRPNGRHCVVEEASILCSDLVDHLEHILKLPPGTQVRLRAGRTAPHESVKKVMDLLDSSVYRLPSAAVSAPKPAAVVTPKVPAAAKLSARDRNEVSAMACGSPGTGEAERMDARVGAGPARALEVSVQCKPHRVEQSLPVMRLVNCSSAGGRWKCEEGRDAMRVSFSDSASVLVVPDRVEPQVATAVVAEAGKLTVPPFHRSASLYMTGQCLVSPVDGRAFKGLLTTPLHARRESGGHGIAGRRDAVTSSRSARGSGTSRTRTTHHRASSEIRPGLRPMDRGNRWHDTGLRRNDARGEDQ